MVLSGIRPRNPGGHAGQTEPLLKGVFMKIIVADRESIERGLVVRSSYVLISITDPHRPDAKVPKTSGCRAVLRLKFDDAEPTPPLIPPTPPRYCNDDDCEKIARFVVEHEEQVGAIVVHCEQGMSRSPVVAAAIVEHRCGNPLPYYVEYAPNKFVFLQVRKAFVRIENADQTPGPDAAGD